MTAKLKKCVTPSVATAIPSSLKGNHSICSLISSTACLLLPELNARTLKPSCRSRLTKAEPTKPVAPVTRAIFVVCIRNLCRRRIPIFLLRNPDALRSDQGKHLTRRFGSSRHRYWSTLHSPGSFYRSCKADGLSFLQTRGECRCCFGQDNSANQLGEHRPFLSGLWESQTMTGRISG